MISMGLQAVAKAHAEALKKPLKVAMLNVDVDPEQSPSPNTKLH